MVNLSLLSGRNDLMMDKFFHSVIYIFLQKRENTPMCCSFMLLCVRGNLFRQKCKCFLHWFGRVNIKWKMFILFFCWCCPGATLNLMLPHVAYFCHKQLHPSCPPSLCYYFQVFLHYSDERSDQSDLFSKDVVMVGAHSCGNLAPDRCQVGNMVLCMQSKRTAAISSYHTQSYCARQAITRSIYRMAADTLRARIFCLMCDIMGSFQSCHCCVTNPPQLFSVDSIMMNTLPETN